MRQSFPAIAYAALDVCNGVEMAAIEAAVAGAGLTPGARALDLGTGNGAVAVRLAERFGLVVEAVELDPAVAALARDRAARSAAAVTVTEAASGAVLAAREPVDLIVALGTTDVTGQGRLAPEAAFAALKRSLNPGGWLLWGDLTWIAEPPGPLRRMAESTGLHADDAGWRAAAAAAGYAVVSGDISPQAVWDRYAATSLTAVADWLRAHPDAPEADAVRAAHDRIAAFFAFGRPFIGFGLYLLKAL